MIVYQVVMPYDSGSHDSGYWRSPLFLDRLHAEDFKKKLCELTQHDSRRWWSSDAGGGLGPEDAIIVAQVVLEEPVKKIGSPQEYLCT